MAIISSFYCCKKALLILMNICMIVKNFTETSLPEKEDFYSHLNMEDITDADYAHTKGVSKDFEIKN